MFCKLFFFAAILAFAAAEPKPGYLAGPAIAPIAAAYPAAPALAYGAGFYGAPAYGFGGLYRSYGSYGYGGYGYPYGRSFLY